MRQAIQNAVIEAVLAATPVVTAVGGRIYDEPPDELTGGGPAYPYITIGQQSSTDWDTKTTIGAEVTTQIDIWSQAGGKAEVLDIIDKLVAALHEADLNLSGHILSRVELTDVLRQDEVTYQGVVQLRSLATEN
mgnify:CR=1 FL=1